LAFVTGDRPGLQTQVATEQLVQLPRHLDAIGRQDRLGILLYTRGGETHAAWPFVNFLREYCKELIALVPFNSHSAGTLLALGADRIVMSRFATLSPIDPNVANPFNPQDPSNPQNRIPIAVEDVMAFFELGQRQGARRKEDKAAAFNRLAESVHPLALGNVQRSIDQIRQLADKMIRLHSPGRSQNEVEQLVHRLTTALYSHFHLIGRREATEIGLPVDSPRNGLDDLLLQYYSELCNDLELLSKFDPGAILRASQSGAAAMPPGPVTVRLERAYIETATTADAYVTHGSVSLQAAQVQAPPGMPVAVPQVPTLQVTAEGWEQLQ
jgi:serine dehydrogenase proteinase